ncbi:MAG: hypothetical protein Q7V63_04140 [Gammaproteobacteria bacterium]|nr:hypothetical protein [Gammaproteobacteria bacterium]
MYAKLNECLEHPYTHIAFWTLTCATLAGTAGFLGAGLSAMNGGACIDVCLTEAATGAGIGTGTGCAVGLGIGSYRSSDALCFATPDKLKNSGNLAELPGTQKMGDTVYSPLSDEATTGYGK